MTQLRIGLIGAGYMGKVHTLAWQSVRTVFDTALSPVCEMLATSSDDGAREHRAPGVGGVRPVTGGCW